MKKYNYIFLLLTILSLIFIFCAKLSNEKFSVKNKKSDNDLIRLWCNFERKYYSEEFKYYITRNAMIYCKRNNISLEIVEFDPKILSYEDYVFKRNLAANNGNIIIIDDLSSLSDLDNNHADYSKLKVYDSLLEPYKNRFCIPIGRLLKSSFFDNAILEFYNIDIPQSPVITYTKYLEIKQELKERGANFEHKNDDFYETIKYYLYKNGLLYINRQDKILKEGNKFKESLKKTIYDLCEDVVLYDESKIDNFAKIDIPSYMGLEMYDRNSKLSLKEEHFWDSSFISIIDPMWFRHKDANTAGKTFIIDYFSLNCKEYLRLKSPSLFIHKKISNDKIYDLADYILEQSSAIFCLKTDVMRYSPILYTDNVLNELKLDNNLEYLGRIHEHTSRNINTDVRKIISAAFDVFVKDEISSKEMADEYFTDIEILWSIESLMYDVIIEISEKLSGKNSENNLYLDGFNREDMELNELVDNKIDEFIQQLVIRLIE